MMTIDLEFEKTRNLGDGMFQCMKCRYKFKANWLQCENCLLSKGIYKDYKTGTPIASAQNDPRRHADCYCEDCTETQRRHRNCLCAFCQGVVDTIRGCTHEFLPTAPEPSGCIRKGCKSHYVKWLNYLAPKYSS